MANLCDAPFYTLHFTFYICHWLLRAHAECQDADDEPLRHRHTGHRAAPCGHFASLVRSVATLLARLPSEAKLLRRIFVTQSEQTADNKGDDENKPAQVNPVTVDTRLK